MASGVRAAVATDGADLVVTPVGVWSKLACLRWDLRIPIAAIANVTVSEAPSIRGLKVAGTGIPGRVTAGVFGFREPRTFAIVGTARPVVVVETHGFPYERVVFSADDPAETQRNIERAVDRRRT